MSAPSEKPYAVNLWGSDPAEDNDDCWTGDDFATPEEAERVYTDPVGHFSKGAPVGYYSTGELWVELDGPDGNKTRSVRGGKRIADDSDWRQERATQAGMAFGCDGYNDAMGW